MALRTEADEEALGLDLERNADRVGECLTCCDLAGRNSSGGPQFAKGGNVGADHAASKQAALRQPADPKPSTMDGRKTRAAIAVAPLQFGIWRSRLTEQRLCKSRSGDEFFDCRCFGTLDSTRERLSLVATAMHVTTEALGVSNLPTLGHANPDQMQPMTLSAALQEKSARDAAQALKLSTGSTREQ